MIRLKWILFSVLFVMMSCTKTVDYGLGDFRLDLVSVAEENGVRYYLLDDQTKLFPETVVSSSLQTGTRALLNYNLKSLKGENSYTISVNSVSKINTGTIKPTTANLPDDPLRAEAVWLAGDWLNFRLSFSYFSMKHSIDIFQNKSVLNDTVYLELHHSKNGDTSGYWINTYFSCNVKAFAQKDTIPIKLRINTSNEGYKYLLFRYATPTPN